jgi:hypothetical protein
MEPSSKISRFVSISLWVSTIIFLSYFKWNYHELWKDEWQAWFVARDKSIGELFSFLYYEGHPILWYLYLKILSIFEPLIGAINVISIAHVITIAGGLYFLHVRFKMSILLKILFTCSYFLLFEYGVINRGYFLVILFSFWAVDLIRSKSSHPYMLGIVLALLCQTEVYGVFLAMSISFYAWLESEDRKAFLSSSTFKWLMGGMLFFVLSVFPRSLDHISKTQGKAWSFSDKIGISFQGNLSNTYLIGSTPDTASYGATMIGLMLSLATIVGLWLVLRKKPSALMAMALFVTMMVGFGILFFVGGVRQWGIGFVALIGFVELTQLELKRDWIQHGILSIFAVFSIIHGFKAIKTDSEIAFTNAKRTGEFIQLKVPEKVPVIALNKFEATPVIGYTGRKFYELPDGKEFSYFRWVDKIYLPTENEIMLFAKFKNVGGVILLSPTLIDENRFPSATLWESFTDENYKNEKYYLYVVKAK